MRSYLLLVVICLLPTLAFARYEGDGGRFSLSGFYGVGSVSPSDVNNYLTAQSSTPALGQLSSSTLYGAKLGVMISPRLQLEVSYDEQDAKNPKDTNLGSGAGMELQQNNVWAGFNVFLTHPGAAYAYVGGAAGYPTYAHAIYTTSSATGYEATKQTVYKGSLGLGFRFSRVLGIFFEGDYEFLNQGVLSNNGTDLTNGTSKVNMDLSGIRGFAGLTLTL